MAEESKFAGALGRLNKKPARTAEQGSQGNAAARPHLPRRPASVEQQLANGAIPTIALQRSLSVRSRSVKPRSFYLTTRTPRPICLILSNSF